MRIHFTRRADYILCGDLGVTTGKGKPEYLKEGQKGTIKLTTQRRVTIEDMNLSVRTYYIEV